MTVADFCVLAAALLPYFAIAAGKANGRREYDNANPRSTVFYSEGFRARAWGAHLNSFEAFPFFAAAVLLAELRVAPQPIINTLALCFIVTRVIYILAYLGNTPSLRSLAWFVGFFLSLGLFVLPAFGR